MAVTKVQKGVSAPNPANSKKAQMYTGKPSKASSNTTKLPNYGLKNREP